MDCFTKVSLPVSSPWAARSLAIRVLVALISAPWLATFSEAVLFGAKIPWAVKAAAVRAATTSVATLH